jgi:hypothetical protein
MRTVEMDAKALEEFAASPGGDGPIVMVNLLRYREEAAYAAGSDEAPCSGREAYQERYGSGVVPLIHAVGGRPIWFGRASFTVLAPEGERWDEAVLVEYPSRKAFLERGAARLAPDRDAGEGVLRSLRRAS